MTCGPFEVVGQSVLVTGGSRGLGAAIVQAFSQAGARVAFCHLGDAERASGVVAQGGEVFAAECDVSDEDQVERFVRAAEDWAGPIDCLVTCAGIGASETFETLTPAIWDRMIAVHLRGTYLCSRAVYLRMRKRGRGRIITIASQLAYSGDASLIHYSAAKAGILGFTRALAREAAPHGVLVNAVAPGAIETDMTASHPDSWRQAKRLAIPLARFASPEEIAPSILFLASSAGSYFAGQTIMPTGGEVMM